MANLLLDATYSEDEYIAALQNDFKHRAAGYDSGRSGSMHHDLIERLLSVYAFQSPVLDVACGTGYLCGRVLSSGGVATGLDVTEEMLCEARRRYNGANFVAGRAEDLPFNDHTFGSVYVCCALAYFVDIRQAFREILRVLRPRGFFAYQAASGDSYITGLALQEACVRVLGPLRGAQTFRVPNIITDTPEVNCVLMQATGFQNVRVVEYEETPVLTFDAIKHTWTGGLLRNALLGRIVRLSEEEIDKVYSIFIECMEERRGDDGQIREKLRSYFVQGWKM